MFSRKRGLPHQRAFLLKLRAVKRGLRVTILLVANKPVSRAQLTFYKFRDEEVNFSATAKVESVRLLSRIRDIPALLTSGMRRYRVSFDIPNIPWRQLRSAMYSFSVRTNVASCAVRTTSLGLVELTSSDSLWYYGDPSGGVLRAELIHQSKSGLDSIRRVKTPDPNDIVCLIGEYSNSARDNGYALFRQLYHAPLDGLVVRYVVEADNPDGLITGINGVIEYGSREHLEWCRRAQVVAFTHHAHYVLPGVTRYFGAKKFRKTKRFFLQHGITALKASMQAYRKRETHYDAINVCSQLEQSIVADACGFPLSDVRIAGFPRHDLLIRQASQVAADPSQVLVFPTWRKGLEQLDSEVAAETDFVREWTGFLRALKNATGVKVAFVLHPVLRRHTHLFEPFADVVSDAVYFQEVLTKSSALITDYSSVCFEALYLNKPVFFFTFDAESYRFADGAFIDVDKDLPGFRSSSTDAMIAAVKAARDAAWPAPRLEDVSRFFAHRDDQNYVRCGEVILGLGKALNAEFATTVPIRQGIN